TPESHSQDSGISMHLPGFACDQVNDIWLAIPNFIAACLTIVFGGILISRKRYEFTRLERLALLSSWKNGIAPLCLSGQPHFVPCRHRAPLDQLVLSHPETAVFARATALR